jgi:cell division protein FtsB
MFPIVVRRFLVSTARSIAPASRSLVGSRCTLPVVCTKKARTNKIRPFSSQPHNEESVMGTVTRLENEKVTLTADVARLETENIQLRAKNKDLREKLDMLQDKWNIVDDVDKDYASRIIKLEKENKSLREQNEVLRTWVSLLDKQVSSLTDDMTSLNTQVTNLERDISSVLFSLILS